MWSLCKYKASRETQIEKKRKKLEWLASDVTLSKLLIKIFAWDLLLIDGHEG